MMKLLLQKALSGVNLPFLDTDSCGHNFSIVMELCVAPTTSLPAVIVPIIPAHNDWPSSNNITTFFQLVIWDLRKLNPKYVKYWVGMLQDIERYCRECTFCHCTKPPAPATAPLTSIPIGRPWEMIAVDILEVPVSQNNNCIS